MNPFAEKYKTLSIGQLLEIIDTPDNYQPLAITAAEDELLARNFSIEEMSKARAENDLRANEKEAKTERKRAFENKLVDAASAVIETIHPVQKTPASVNRVILLISIVFGILGVVQVYFFVKYLPVVLHFSYHIPISMAMPYFFQGFYLLGTAFLFWKRMKWGWIFLAIYTTYSALGAIFLMLVELRRSGILPGTPHRYYPDYAPSFLFNLLFYGCCIWFIYKRDIRALYKIDKALAIIAAATGLFLMLLVFALILHGL
jgi:hypothetical protein